MGEIVDLDGHRTKKQSEFAEFLKKLEVVTATPEWKGSVDAQADILQRLGPFRALVPATLYQKAMDIIQKGLGIEADSDRFRYLLELKHMPELRRALRFERPTGHHRFEDEQVYPQDGSWIAQYLLHAQASEPPIAWHFWVGLSILGAICRRNIYIDKNVFYIWPNLFLMLVGPTTSKKSTAMNIGREVLERANEYLEKQNVKDYRRIRIIPQRCTPERFVQLMKSESIIETHGTNVLGHVDTESVGVIFNSEIVVMLGKTAFHADNWVTMVTALYDCPDKYDGSTIGRGDEMLHNVALTFVGGSTADWIRSSVTEVMFGGGFMGRFIFSRRQDRRREYPEPEPIDPVMQRWLAEEVLHYSQMAVQEFVRPPAWKAYFQDWYHENKQIIAEDVKMEGYYGRKPIHLEKVAMLIGLSRGSCTGVVEDLELARKVLDIEEKHLPKLFGEMLAHQDSLVSDRIYNTIVRNGRTILQSTLLRKMIRDVGNAFTLKRYLETLQAEGRIKPKYDKVKRATFWVAMHVDPDDDEPDPGA